jgi:hypothetical protein
MNANELTQNRSDFLRDLGKAARDNPIPAALIGMGLIWLISGGKPVARAAAMAHSAGLDRLPERAADTLDAGRSAIRSGVSAASEAASQTGARISDTLNTIGGRIGETASAVTDNVRAAGSATADRIAQAGGRLGNRSEGAPLFSGLGGDFVANARANVMDAFHRQPLLLGALGVALGAGIAASLPSTAREAELFGDRSDRLKESAGAFAVEQTRRAGQLASDVTSAAADEARSQGLTIDAAKAAAGDIGSKLKNVADAAASSARTAAVAS